MTAAEFWTAYGATCQEVSAGTGIDPVCLASQYACETGWGSAVYNNNIGNIECGPGVFCHYPTLSDYAQAAISVWHQSNFEAYRAACVGAVPETQLQQICNSPWDAGHYGGSLNAYYLPLEELFAMTQAEFDALVASNPSIGPTGYAARNAYGLGMSYHPGQPNLDTSAVLADILTAIANLAAEVAKLQPSTPTTAPTKFSGKWNGVVSGDVSGTLA